MAVDLLGVVAAAHPPEGALDHEQRAGVTPCGHPSGVRQWRTLSCAGRSDHPVEAGGHPAAAARVAAGVDVAVGVAPVADVAGVAAQVPWHRTVRRPGCVRADEAGRRVASRPLHRGPLEEPALRLRLRASGEAGRDVVVGRGRSRQRRTARARAPSRPPTRPTVASAHHDLVIAEKASTDRREGAPVLHTRVPAAPRRPVRARGTPPPVAPHASTYAARRPPITARPSSTLEIHRGIPAGLRPCQAAPATTWTMRGPARGTTRVRRPCAPS